MGAMAIGMPGCPLPAFSIASMASVRIVLMQTCASARVSVAMRSSSPGVEGEVCASSAP
jgi:hypothetical protein